ncbi:hypothetical protein WAI453_006445 [Rhynchosporium graminicola]
MIQSVTKREESAFVVKNDCADCKQKRTKCDEQNPCAGCIALAGTACNNEVTTRVSKEAMQAEIKRLEAYQRASECVLSRLASEDRSDLILRQLEEGKSVQHIYRTLKGDTAVVQSP